MFCANGSNEAIQCLLLAYGGPGRAAMVFEPTYALHSHIARLTGTSVVQGRRDGAFRLDLDEVARTAAESAVRHGAGAPAVTFLCSPNNPTGGLETNKSVRAVLSLVPGLVAVDEAYGQFAPWSALELVAGEPRLLVLRTFSKTWAMAGLRLGYVIADPGVVASLSNVALPYHLDALKQAAGRVALGFGEEMRARVATIVEERGRVAAGLAELGLELWPSESNFILFRVSPRTGPRSGKASWTARFSFVTSLSGRASMGAFVSRSATEPRTSASSLLSPRCSKISRNVPGCSPRSSGRPAR